MFQAGQQIGVYKLIRKLAKGGFGEVWLAEKQSEFVTKKFAIKLPLDEQVDFEAIRHEATLWEQASGHPNVLPLIDADIYDNQVAIISEYAEDGSLDDKLKKIGKFPIEQAVELTIGILNGLDYLHSKNIIHRDVKPQNILLQGDTPRLTDFGISRAIHTSTISSVIVGTENYMAPEAFEGVRNVQTDVWSVGVVLYKLLSGRMPFPQANPSEIMYAVLMNEPAPLPEEIPVGLQKIIFKALEKDCGLNGNPPQRYQSAAEMREDLLNFLEMYSQSLSMPEMPVMQAQTHSEIPTRVKMHIPLQSPGNNIFKQIFASTKNLPFVIILGLAGILLFGWLAVKIFSGASATSSNISNTVKNSNLTANGSSVSTVEYSERAYKYFEKKDYNRAIEVYSEAIELNPNDYTLYNDRGLVYYTKRDYDKAIADFDKSIELHPASLTYNNRGVAYEDKGDRENAVADYRKALQLDPDNEQANQNLEKLNERRRR